MSLNNTKENLGDLSNGGTLRWPSQLFVPPPRHLSIVFLPIGADFYSAAVRYPIAARS
jgi:hypothetical protein